MKFDRLSITGEIYPIKINGRSPLRLRVCSTTGVIMISAASRPFFCQVEAAETAIWLTEVAPKTTNGKRFLAQLASANKDANPELARLAVTENG